MPEDVLGIRTADLTRTNALPIILEKGRIFFITPDIVQASGGNPARECPTRALFMKLAVTGKGGVGKTTLAASLGITLERQGRRVILIDADPDANLQNALGIGADIPPLIELKTLIAERTALDGNAPGPVFKLNPRVDDIPEKFFYRRGNLMVGVMGTVRGGGLGCACPENSFLKALLRHLILARGDTVILDMEAGIEHLGRGTTAGMDYLLVVCEPSLKSVETALRIRKLAGELGIKRVGAVGSKVASEAERAFLSARLAGLEILALVPYHAGVKAAELGGRPFWEESPGILDEAKALFGKLEAIHGQE